MTYRRPQTGFTLVELIVAVGITSLLMTLVIILFNETSDAVNRGIQTSQITAKDRSIGDQIQRDVKDLIPPGSNHARGYLVILNHRVRPQESGNDAGVTFRGRGQDDETRFVRSDQLAFVVRRDDPAHAITPKNDNTYGTDLRASATRIWYGHLNQLNASSPHPNVTPDAALGEYANRWQLGRQALLLADDDDNPNNTPSWDTGNTVYAQGPVHNASVVNRGGGSAGLFEGYTDVVDLSLNRYTGEHRYDSNSGEWLAPWIPAEGDEKPPGEPGTYSHAEVNQIYLNQMFAFPAGGDNVTRLRFRPQARNALAPEDVAQKHPHLASNVSDFVVQFAADLNNNGLVDRMADENNNGSIIDEIDDNFTSWSADGASNPDWDQHGQIIWYDLDMLQRLNDVQGDFFDNPWADIGDYRDSEPDEEEQDPLLAFGDGNYSGTWPALADHAFVFRYNDYRDDPGEPGNSMWPYLVRVRYRVHDESGELRTQHGPNLTDGIDNDMDGDTNVDDGDPDEADIPGQWFEHVFRVRPFDR